MRLFNYISGLFRRKRSVLHLDIETSRPDYLRPDVGNRRYFACDMKTGQPFDRHGDVQAFFYRMGMGLYDQIHGDVAIQNKQAAESVIKEGE